MTAQRIFRDPVHTSISLRYDVEAEGLALRLIDTNEVQRLRHIRQLGLANFVYHGAEHSRFSHSLGVVHLARRYYEAALANSGKQRNDEEFAIVLAAAVLHDVGHPPFSHALEKVLGVDHEAISVLVLENETQVRSVLMDFGGEGFIGKLAEHFTDTSDRRSVTIISSQLDADRSDYVLRDGYFAGIPNAQFDLERIIQKTRIDNKGLLFDERAQQAIEGYFIARYHLYLQLYYHKAVRAAEALLRACIQRAKDFRSEGGDLGEIGPVAALFAASPNLEIVANLTDHELWAAFRYWSVHSKDPLLKDLSSRLLHRRLFKAFDVPSKDFFEHGHDMVQEMTAIAEENGYPAKYYIRKDSAKDNPYKLSDPTLGGTAIKSTRILRKNGEIRALETASGVVKALQDEAYQLNRICYPGELRDKLQAVISG